jgi:nicotinate-nucleotide pyrophosphorylase (carboxylating)
LVSIEVEVETLDELREALGCRTNAILLDNMNPAQVREAVEITQGSTILEVSGGINPENILEFAQTGVDLISVGWLTHSSPALDVSLKLEPL